MKKGTNIRFLPLQSTTNNLNYLKDLHPPKELYQWLAAFDNNNDEYGHQWNLNKAKHAYSPEYQKTKRSKPKKSKLT